MYSLSFTPLASHCDANRELKLSALMALCEEASIADTTRLHMGREKTLDKGILWVILRMGFKIKRMPQYDEKCKLISYPERSSHGLFPRYYIIKSANNEVLLEGEAIWTLIDEKTRRPVNAKEYGIHISARSFVKDFDVPMGVIKMDIDGEKEYLVCYSDLDLNGHLTNTRYGDILLNLHDECFYKGHRLSDFVLSFTKEVKEGETLKLRYGQKGDTLYVKGGTIEGEAFESRLSFVKK